MKPEHYGRADEMFLTRLGFNAKAVITGDVTQIDLPSARHRVSWRSSRSWKALKA